LAFATEDSEFPRNDTFGVLATSLIWQIVLGVEYLERKGVAHRDLKPANIVVGPGGEVVRPSSFAAKPRSFSNQRYSANSISSFGVAGNRNSSTSGRLGRRIEIRRVCWMAKTTRNRRRR